MRKQHAKTVEEKNKFSDELQQITTTFFGPIEVAADLTKEERETLDDCVEFIKLNSSVHANIGVRNKAIQKKIGSINSLLGRSKNLYNQRK